MTAPHDDAAPTGSPAGAGLLQLDAAAQALGIRLVGAGPCGVTVELTIGPEMFNGLGTCHGGVIFTLADTAMALVSNASGERAMAIHADIDWLRPVHAGTVLTATARQVARQGRTAVNDVTVADDSGAVVALFRGRTRVVG